MAPVARVTAVVHLQELEEREAAITLHAIISNLEQSTVTAAVNVRLEGLYATQLTSSVTEGVLTAKFGVSLLPKAWYMHEYKSSSSLVLKVALNTPSH